MAADRERGGPSRKEKACIERCGEKPGAKDSEKGVRMASFLTASVLHPLSKEPQRKGGQ